MGGRLDELSFSHYEVLGADLSADYGESEDEEGQAAECTYPGGCGDLFVVSIEELNEAGFTGMTCPSGITDTCKTPEPLKVRTERSSQWQRNSLVLPCQSCSLHIRLHLLLQ
ncbi:hypothetical protein MPTK1_6g11280 [Marchantia polymorpha subsp. ruderalis]|uniref:Uncharacterized protein n=2 Tax=Marchantia polymorpha TaxID=3197 RepID=A0AAF6BQV7_MARPO|nr:hypothetical protein MARPO_2945s0001 [Marchantia polymorpha]BBN14391.1 hypothetical protein Mp_6g11280 [Marchantia polymorpha subsp. ruderalis]|eukprot:PTQ26312.1 hypothetical protein MARPO_2945s0001 [Marchantia polymorpha]